MAGVRSSGGDGYNTILWRNAWTARVGAGRLPGHRCDGPANPHTGISSAVSADIYHQGGSWSGYVANVDGLHVSRDRIAPKGANNSCASARAIGFAKHHRYLIV